jgi:hypothetical protein
MNSVHFGRFVARGVEKLIKQTFYKTSEGKKRLFKQKNVFFFGDCFLCA